MSARMEIGYDGNMYPVKHKPLDNDLLEKDTFYIIGAYVYRYIGNINRLMSLPAGCIAKVNDQYMISDHKKEDEEEYHVRNISFMDDAETMDDIIDAYYNSFTVKQNIMKNLKRKNSNMGELYVPDLKETDDGLSRILKLMIRHVGVIRNNYKNVDDTALTNSYEIDNMISALNGATANTTITRFLLWCDILKLDWEFTLTDLNIPGLNKLGSPLSISSREPLTCDFGDTVSGIFKVPLVEGEDPLKRLIKVALIKLNVNLNDYKDRGSTPHLINNMRSALKRKSKMMLPYFMNWCEILGLNYSLKIINPVDGVSFEVDINYKATDME